LPKWKISKMVWSHRVARL